MAAATSFSIDGAIKPGASFDSSKLAGRSVVLTGGASGIGEGILRAFVAVGAFVTFGDVAEDRGLRLLSELGADKVDFVHCDILNWADQVRLFKTALAKAPSKTIDIVCANAGIGIKDDMLEHELDSEGDPIEPKFATLKTNLIGTGYTAKLALHYLSQQPQGEDRDRCLIMTASVSAYMDHPGEPQYNASKWGTRGLFRSLRNTMPKQGMRVSIIAPWFVRTRIIPREHQPRMESSGVEWATVEDAGAAVLHIAADRSVNGRSLCIVPRTKDPRGYTELEKDYTIGDRNAVWANLGIE